MTIKKAIEMLTIFGSETEGYFADDEISAIKLGIEALKRIQERRDLKTGWEAKTLPGETKD